MRATSLNSWSMNKPWFRKLLSCSVRASSKALQLKIIIKSQNDKKWVTQWEDEWYCCHFILQHSIGFVWGAYNHALLISNWWAKVNIYVRLVGKVGHDDKTGATANPSEAMVSVQPSYLARTQSSIKRCKIVVPFGYYYHIYIRSFSPEAFRRFRRIQRPVF